LAYSGHVKNLLIKSNPQFDSRSIDIKIIKTSGDIFQNKRISEIGGKGVFCKQIEDELLESKIDLAVHSLKDLPTKMTKGLCVNTVVKRNDPRDVFLSSSTNSLNELKPQSKIGTSSFRRHAQLKMLRDDLTIVPMRGNIDTRIKKLKNKEFDAIVLSLAGIQMLNLKDEIKEIFNIDQMLPALGQGAIAVQCKQADHITLNTIKKINHEETYYCVQAERSLLETIGGDCDTAIGGLAKISNKKIFLKSELFSNDGKKKFIAQNSGHFKEAREIGYKVGNELLRKAGPDFTTQGN
jgi:hydroxymethylbilane synthase